ncbi:unnamed protein product [Thelazia callipaeda]|uniref:Caskin-1 n=1 Tax=Thelazia callipaeda TaxID=103827 RepID=A0A0N5CZY7_THECL|nr:unnamed protein product [Thelazia callipaeda]
MHPVINTEEDSAGNVSTLSPSSVSLKQRSFHVIGHNSENLSCSGCHRNSTGSSSSHDSSSGFESMKSGSSHGCSTTDSAASAVSSNSSLLATSVGQLTRGDSPLSRLSTQSIGSVSASPVVNNVSNVYEETRRKQYPGQNTDNNCKVSVSDMVLKGVPEAEILALWLDSLGHSEYLSTFLTQGYDLTTIARITPEDLTALGITQPSHRKLLISEIHKWRVTDAWPASVPSGELREWLLLIGLPEYIELFEVQGYSSLGEVQSLTWEDFGDIGIKKLGHLKRLGLAIKKIKDHETSRSQSSCKLQQLVSVAVHHNKLNNQQVDDNFHLHQTPPPPAPTSTLYPASSGGLHDQYGTWKQHPHYCDVLSTDLHTSQKQMAYQHYRLAPYRSQEISECDDTTECDMNEQKSSSVQLNLYSPSRILSDGGFQKQSFCRRPLPPAKILSTADNSITSDPEDYPPPPAPLACEGSIRFLRSAFHESAIAAAESERYKECNFEKNYNINSSFRVPEHLPFANDNCGTIKSRDSLSYVRKVNEQSNVDSFSQPNTPRRDATGVFIDDAELSSYSASASNGSVLNDIGSMLKNLTDELDALL